MVSKKEFFKELDKGKRYHPTKVLPRSKIAIVTPQTSTDVIENLKPDEAAIIPYSLIPYGYREGPEATERFPMFLKRGPTVEVATPKTLEEALKGTGPTRRRLEAYLALHDHHSEIIAAGISWYCPQDRMHRKVSANDVVEGMQIYAFSERERLEKQPTKNHLTHVHEYGIDTENKDSGASAVIDVPSRSLDQPYRVKLHHFPFIGSQEEWVWMQLLTEHDCGSKIFGDIYWQRDPETKKRRKLRDIVFCPHDVAAYLALSREETNRIISSSQRHHKFALQPFPLFTQHTVDFWNKLWSQTFYGSPQSARMLRGHELEPELQRFLLRRDPTSTMYISNKDKIRDYRWTAHFPVKE